MPANTQPLLAPFHPIIYVRGYAMTKSEQDETTADPFCGFNVGSTVYRATPDKDKPARKFIFESPVLRLSSDFQYRDVYENGLDIVDPAWSGPIPYRSIIIYRYYEQASVLLGSGKTPEIEDFARGLSQLILRVRELVCQHPDKTVNMKNFRCYLVAHSMGGLVCRAFLQNPALGDAAARACVDKVFTYATPHNGIEMLGFNTPKFLSINDINNFNRERMAKYLNLTALYRKTKRVDWLPEEHFPSERFFCMIGSNRSDYEVAMGSSRAFAGHGSDGLVKIDNASVWGTNAKGQLSAPCATAHAYRSHSGYFGIVNSEESYQNLTRFLFGDVRVDIWLEITAVQLPVAIKNKSVDALYEIETVVSPRGKRWNLTRRVAEEDSVACRSHQALADPNNKAARMVYLTTIFLSKQARINPDRPSLAYAFSLGIRAPDYEVERKFWPNEHYEGGYLFRDLLVTELTPPQTDDGTWQVNAAWQSTDAAQTIVAVDTKALRKGKLEIRIPFGSNAAPGIRGNVKFLAAGWNE